MTCTSCQMKVPTVYSDWSKVTGRIRICFRCLKTLSWQAEIDAIIANLRQCISCQCLFLPRKPEQIRCGCCWSKILPKPKRQEASFKGVPITSNQDKQVKLCPN